ncbi:MAG: hypothetical protein LUG91_07690 [Ruminococcus sp.]|nr:hypothetical protein [Ruminococcus sp.]
MKLGVEIMICKFCGALLEDDWVFCVSCGKSTVTRKMLLEESLKRLEIQKWLNIIAAFLSPSSRIMFYLMLFNDVDGESAGPISILFCLMLFRCLFAIYMIIEVFNKSASKLKKDASNEFISDKTLLVEVNAHRESSKVQILFSIFILGGVIGIIGGCFGLSAAKEIKKTVLLKDVIINLKGKTNYEMSKLQKKNSE